LMPTYDMEESPAILNVIAGYASTSVESGASRIPRRDSSRDRV
jgi:hypothetical protein